MTQIPELQVGSITVPQYGYGTWKAAPGEVGKAVKEAVIAGYRHLDCAQVYGNEKEIGTAVSELYSENVVKREDLFIVSKVWNTNHAPEHVREACLKQLKDLQTDYLDLYLVHTPASFEYTGPNLEPAVPKDESGNIRWGKIPLYKTWEAMEKLVEDGLVKSIGVSNYTIPLLADLLTYARIRPITNQVETHPYFVRKELNDYCKSQGITITAYSPLGSGKVGPLQDPLVQSLAQRYNKTPAQILLRWNLQMGNIVIPKSSNSARLKENLDIFDFKLSAEDWEALANLNRNLVTCDTREYWGFPFFAQ